MKTIFIPTSEFRKHIWDVGDRARLEAIEGFNRWVITREDGTEYVVRPKENE